MRRADTGPPAAGLWYQEGEPADGVALCDRTKEKARCGEFVASGLFVGITAGSDLLSHTVSHAVPSAVAGLTSVFGMGTGVTLLL
jgi:hypothetical protein